MAAVLIGDQRLRDACVDQRHYIPKLADGERTRSTFTPRHVGEVLSVCPDQEVTRVAAGRVVAGVADVVADSQTNPCRRLEYDPVSGLGQTVGGPVGPAHDEEASVTLPVSAARPRPALIVGAYVNMAPEALNERLGFSTPLHNSPRPGGQ